MDGQFDDAPDDDTELCEINQSEKGTVEVSFSTVPKYFGLNSSSSFY